MSEPEALQQQAAAQPESFGKAADEIGRIDDRLSSLIEGRKPGAGVA